MLRKCSVGLEPILLLRCANVSVSLASVVALVFRSASMSVSLQPILASALCDYFCQFVADRGYHVAQMFLSVCLPVFCLSVCLSVYMSVLFVQLPLCLCLSVCLPICLPVCRSLSTVGFPYSSEAAVLRGAGQPDTSERLVLKSGWHMTLHADVCKQTQLLT